MKNNFNQRFINTLFRLKRDTKNFDNFKINVVPMIKISEDITIRFDLIVNTWIIKDTSIVPNIENNYSLKPSDFYNMLLSFSNECIKKALDDYDILVKKEYQLCPADMLYNKVDTYMDLMKIDLNKFVTLTFYLNNGDRIDLFFNENINHYDFFYAINNGYSSKLDNTMLKILLSKSNWHNVSEGLSNLWKSLTVKK